MSAIPCVDNVGSGSGSNNNHSPYMLVGWFIFTTTLTWFVLIKYCYFTRHTSDTQMVVLKNNDGRVISTTYIDVEPHINLTRATVDIGGCIFTTTTPYVPAGTSRVATIINNVDAEAALTASLNQSVSAVRDAVTRGDVGPLINYLSKVRDGTR